MNRAVVANLGWVTVLMGLWLPTAYAQRGMGDAEGLARRGLQPELTKVSGKLVRIETHPCQQTTGQGILGTHVGLLTPEGQTLDIDLGWAAAVESIAARLVIGQPLDAVVFRTDSMPEGRWVAKSLTIDGDVLALRDDRLRPFWAGPGGGQGPSRTAAGSGWGTRGYGVGGGYRVGGGSGYGAGYGYGQGRRWAQGPGRMANAGGRPRYGQR
jgi:hypothetical protein